MQKILYSLLLLILICLVFNVQGQALTTDQKKFLQTNAVTLSADTNFSRAEWKAIAEQVKDKRVILLGEFNHSSKEVFQTRNSLIKYLHRNLGVNVILFESGIGELVMTDIEKATLSPGQMTNGLVGSWRTQEFRELMAYVKAEGMSVAGFDVQRTGGSFVYVLKETAQKSGIDSVHFYNLEQRFGAARQELVNNKTIYDSVKVRTLQLIRDYKQMSDRLVHAAGEATTERKFCVITLKNRIRFMSYMLAFLKDRNPNTRWAARDSAMTENIEWLMTNIYPGKRVLVIAHNFHIGRFNEQETVMGEMLAARYGKQMYALGVFAGGGSFQDNFGRPKAMLPPDSASLDIKHIIASLNGAVNFIHVPRQPGRGGEWLSNPLTVNDTFIDLSGSNKMILSKCFDGLLLIDKISPPEN